MKITKTHIENISDVTMLYLSEEEKTAFVEDLNLVLSQIAKIREVDTDDVEPTIHLLPLKNIWREDKAEPSLKPEEVFKNTKNNEEGFFKVPKIIDG